MKYNAFGDDFTGPPPRWLVLLVIAAMLAVIYGTR